MYQKVKDTIAAVATQIHRHGSALIYVWFVLAVLNVSILRVVGIVCGGVLLAAWILSKV